MPPPKKRLGQHFLTDPRILTRIADALEAGPADTVVEIGPGRGSLTAVLAPRVRRLIAIEKDRELVPALRERFPGVEVVEGDALALDWAALAAAPAGGWLVTGNIPYNLTSLLIDQALAPPRPRRIVFLVQREVAERVGAPPGGADYGALSVGVQAVAGVERLFTVAAGSFSPPPKVDSALLRLTPLGRPLVSDVSLRSFRRMVVGLFGFRRKQMLRGLRELSGWPAERARGVLGAAGIGESRRPQELSPAEFARLHGELVDGGWAPG